LLNNGSAVFSASTPFGSLVSAYQDIEVADIDGDGDLDVLTSDRTSSVLYFWINGPAGFTPRTLNSIPVRDTELGDADGDGDVDLLLTTGTRGGTVYVNDGAGNFTHLPSAMPNVPSSHDSIDTADLDNDGDLDVVAGGGSNHVYINDGTGLFSERSVSWLLFGEIMSNVHLADVTGNGLPDLLGSTSDNTVVAVNTSGRSFGPSIELGAGTGNGLAHTIDGDRDSTREVVVATDEVLSHRLFQARSSTSFVHLTADDAAPELSGGHFLSDAVVADFDRNGLPDVLTSQGRNSPNAKRLGLWLQSDGRLQEVQSPAPAYTLGAREIVVTDVNGDAAPDLVAITGLGRVYVLMNDGTARFYEDPSRIGTVYASSVLAGDFDGDGATDLLVDEKSGKVTLYPQRNGSFVPLGSGTGPYWIRSPAVDLDRDGDLDYVGAPPLVVRLNDGSGNFTPSQQLPNQTRTSAVVAADVDGDGDIDLVGDNLSNLGPQLWTNDGSGVFTESTAGRFPAAIAPFYRLIVADLDDDGDPDVWAGGNDSNVADTWFENDGRGFFTPAPSGRGANAPPSTRLHFAEDVDADGDVDVMAWRDGVRGIGDPPPGPFMLRNLYRQIDVPFSPTRGGSLQLDIYMADGRAGPVRFAIPLIATGLVPPIGLGGLGVWQLGGTALPLPQVTVNGAFVSASYAIPNVTAITNIDLYLQALLAPTAAPTTGRRANVVKRELQ